MVGKKKKKYMKEGEFQHVRYRDEENGETVQRRAFQK